MKQALLTLGLAVATVLTMPLSDQKDKGSEKDQMDRYVDSIT